MSQTSQEDEHIPATRGDHDTVLTSGDPDVVEELVPRACVSSLHARLGHLAPHHVVRESLYGVSAHSS